VLNSAGQLDRPKKCPNCERIFHHQHLYDLHQEHHETISSTAMPPAISSGTFQVRTFENFGWDSFPQHKHLARTQQEAKEDIAALLNQVCSIRNIVCLKALPEGVLTEEVLLEYDSKEVQLLQTVGFLELTACERTKGQVIDIMGQYAFNMVLHMQKNQQCVHVPVWNGISLEELVPDEINRSLLQSGAKLPNSFLL
jgi:hypothetical protein